MDTNKPHRIVHYLNQFYAGYGGEEYAGVRPYIIEGSVGPGKLLEQVSDGVIEIVGTVVCGDNYFVENNKSIDEIMKLILSLGPDGLVAGPAFLSGRYGEACAAICNKVASKLKLPVITGLHPEHPSVKTYRSHIPITKTGNSGADMRNNIPVMAKILIKLLEGIDLDDEDKEKLFKKGLKENVIVKENTAKRALDMLMLKYQNKEWTTELPMIEFDSINPAHPIKENVFKISLITDGGLILKGNPEKMSSGRSDKISCIGISNWDKLSASNVEIYHYGYDTRFVLEDPNRLVPLDVVIEYEKCGKLILHPTIYSTAGVGTSVENAKRFGKEIAQDMINNNVKAGIITST